MSADWHLMREGGAIGGNSKVYFLLLIDNYEVFHAGTFKADLSNRLSTYERKIIVSGW